MNTNYAGFWLRFVAAIIDGIIIGCIRAILILPIVAAMGFGIASNIEHMDTDRPADFVAMLAPLIAMASVVSLISTAVWVLYYTFMESSKLQASVGKLALSLVVTDTNGAKLDFSKALIRNLSKIISGVILCIGFIMAGFTDKKQALHDIIAGTIVVKKQPQVSTQPN
jgi:uncharacterized RDD family membrane protein YckC